MERLISLYNQFMKRMVFETFLKVVYGDQYYEEDAIPPYPVGNCAKLVEELQRRLQKEENLFYFLFPIPAHYDDGSGHILLLVLLKDGTPVLIDPVHDIVVAIHNTEVRREGAGICIDFGASKTHSYSLVGCATLARTDSAFFLGKRYGNQPKHLYKIAKEAFMYPESNNTQEEVRFWKSKFILPDYVTTRAVFARRIINMSGGEAPFLKIPVFEEIYAIPRQDLDAVTGHRRLYTPYGVQTEEWTLEKNVDAQKLRRKLYYNWGFCEEDVREAYTKIRQLLCEQGPPTTIV